MSYRQLTPHLLGEW